jgi:hypothetical protein
MRALDNMSASVRGKWRLSKSSAISLLRLAKKRKQAVDEKPGRFFRNKMAAFGHHLAAHLDRHSPQRLLRRAAASSPVRVAYRADGEQRHPQLEAVDDRLVVGNILRDAR